MAVSKKSSTVPVNMMDTLNSLNSAASAPVTPQPVQPVQPVEVQTPVSSVKSDGIPTVEMVEIAASKQESKPSTVSSSTEKTMISLRLLKNDKEKYQEFFRAHGLSFTDGLYMAADFIEREVENGRLQLSKSGIQYK